MNSQTLNANYNIVFIIVINFILISSADVINLVGACWPPALLAKLLPDKIKNNWCYWNHYFVKLHQKHSCRQIIVESTSYFTLLVYMVSANFNRFSTKFCYKSMNVMREIPHWISTERCAMNCAVSFRTTGKFENTIVYNLIERITYRI